MSRGDADAFFNAFRANRKEEEILASVVVIALVANVELLTEREGLKACCLCDNYGSVNCLALCLSVVKVFHIVYCKIVCSVDCFRRSLFVHVSLFVKKLFFEQKSTCKVFGNSLEGNHAIANNNH